MGSLNAVKLIKYLLIKFMIKIITRNLWISECLIYFTSCSEHWSRPSDAILVRHGSLNKDPHATLKHCRPDNLARGHLSLLHRHTITIRPAHAQRSLNAKITMGVFPMTTNDNQRIGNVLVAFWSVWATFHWRLFKTSQCYQRLTNVR